METPVKKLGEMFGTGTLFLFSACLVYLLLFTGGGRLGGSSEKKFTGSLSLVMTPSPLYWIFNFYPGSAQTSTAVEP